MIISKPWAYYNDFDEDVCDWLEELIRMGEIAPGQVDRRSILDVRPEDVRGFAQCHFFAGIGGWSYALRLAGWPDDEPVWTGSPPCQSFSAAGKQKGKDDERHLAPKFAELVGACRPPMLFGEQVASSLVFGKAAKKARNGIAEAPAWAWLDDLLDRLEAARYAAGASDLPSAGIGAPHIRQRTFFGAVRMADSEAGSEGVVGSGSIGLDSWSSRDARSGHWGGSSDGRMADAECGERGSGSLRGLREADGSQRCGDTAELAGSRDDERLADAAGAGPFPISQRGLHRSEEGAGPRDGKPERSGATQRMADNESGRRGEERQNGGRVSIGDREEGVSAGLGDGGGDYRMGHTIDARLEGLAGDVGDRDQPGRLGEDAPRSVAPASVTGRMEHSSGVGWERWEISSPRHVHDGQASKREQGEHGLGVSGPYRIHQDGTGPTNGFWASPDWLFCRDGKWRPVEARSQQMVDGLPARVGRGCDLCADETDREEEEARRLAQEEIGFPLGKVEYARAARLRGYGNAINPHVAAHFISAFMDALRGGPATLHCQSPFELVSIRNRDMEDLA